LRERQAWAAGWVQQLEVELLFPVGPTSSPQVESAFQRRRGRVRRAELTIEQSALNRALCAIVARSSGLPQPAAQSPAQSPAFALPFDLLRARINGTDGVPGLLLLFRCPAAQGTAVQAGEKDDGTERWPLWGTARVSARRPPSGFNDIVFGISDVRLYGSSRLAAPLLGHALLQVLGAALISCMPAQLPAVTLTSGLASLGLHFLSTPALSELRIELLLDALLDVLPRAGYRAADPATAPLCDVQTQPGQLILRYAGDGQRGGLSYADIDERPRSNPIIEPSALVLGAPIPEALRIADYLLYTGDVCGALAGYQLVSSSPALSGLAKTRSLQLLASAPGLHQRARELGESELNALPSSATALIALATVADNSGQPEAAARRYLALGADPHSHAIERAAAFFAASRYLTRSDPGAARSVREAAESLLTAGEPEEALLEAVQGAAQEVPRKSVNSQPLSVPASASAPAKKEKPAEPPEPAPDAQDAQGAQDTPAAPDAQDEGDAERRKILDEAQLAARLGEIARSRQLLAQGGSHPDFLHARVQVDWPELLQADPGSPSDLLPVLRELQVRSCARPDELRGLARMLTARGEYAEALAVQKQAGADADELLASLEAAGRNRELVAALAVHATHRKETSCLLYQQAANVAEQQLCDRALAASFWQQAADAVRSESPAQESALFWFHAGRLWHEDSNYVRSYAALKRAVELGGDELPRLKLLLGDLAYRLADLEAASLYYRQALDSAQVPAADQAQVYLRIAEGAHRHDDAKLEEQALARAVEAGGGALAWPRLAALFRAQGDPQRLGAALVAWADHEEPSQRTALLREAATLAQPALLPRIDEELVKLDVDDAIVRDRLLKRLEESGDASALLAALRRDVKRSEGTRRRELLPRLVALALKRSRYDAAVEGWLGLLKDYADTAAAETLSAPATAGGPDELPRLIDDALTFFATLERARASLYVPATRIAELRQEIVEVGRLAERWAKLETLLEASFELPLLRRAAQFAELLGYEDAAAQRYLQACAKAPTDRELLEGLRRVLRGLSHAGRAEEALLWVESELRLLGPAISSTQTVALRTALGELFMFLARTSEALAQLELVLLRSPHFGPAHALLGMLLGTSREHTEVQRALEHLLLAAYAPDVEAHEAGECALLVADMLASAGISEPVETGALLSAASAAPGYAERASTGTYVAVPTDFLEPALSDEGADAGSAATASPPVPPVLPVLPPLLGPVEMLLHAAPLLHGDPRPLEGLLGLCWSRGDYTQALECCDRLLALPCIAADPAERSRLRVEKAHVLNRLEFNKEAEALLRQALADAPESVLALRSLRRLLSRNERGKPEEALALLQTEIKLCPDEDLPGLAALWNELGLLHARLEHPALALEAFRRTGQLGLAAGFCNLAEGLAARGDFLGAADAAGRGAALMPHEETSASERGPVLLRAAELALRADDELRARDYLTQAVALRGTVGEQADERLRELDGGPEPEIRRRTLERRLKQTRSGVERLEILRRLVLLCAELYERTAMVSYATMLLRESAGDALALCTLAEDAIEHGQLELAASRIAQAGVIPPSYPHATRLLSCISEVFERRGNTQAAVAAYQRLLEAAERSGDVPAIELAIEGLARLREEQGDAADALRWLRRRLPYLPADALPARATLRLRMSDFAVSLGDLDTARGYLLEVLEENPVQRSALVKLLEVYRQLDQPAEELRILDRLLDLTMTPGERAEWLFSRAELYEKRIGNLDEAALLYEQVLTQWPAHARALRRVIALAVRRGDSGKVAATIARLDKAGAPLADVQVLAGVGLLLSDGEMRSAGATPNGHALLRTASAAELASALSAIGLAAGEDLRRLDGPLQGAIAALGGDAGQLLIALRELLHKAETFELNTTRLMARLCEQLGLSEQGLYLAALAFLDPGGYADERLDELGASPVPEVALQEALAALRPVTKEQAPWLAVFGLLGRHILGLQIPVLPQSSAGSVEWGERLSELGRSLGFAQIEVAVVDELDGDKAVCDPSRPPRLRLLRTLTAREPQARFAALRALHLLLSGVPLAERGGPEGMAALLRASAALWLEGTPGIPRVQDIQQLLPRERDWLATLRALALHPEHSPGVMYEARAEAEAVQLCLASLAERPQRLAELWPELLATARLRASARALAELGDLRAALRVLYRSPAAHADGAAKSEPRSEKDDRGQRLAALQSGPLCELFALAKRLYV
jgi:hypothetical protein